MLLQAGFCILVSKKNKIKTMKEVRLFENNICFSWKGDVLNERDTKTGKVVELKSAEPVKSGLTPGAADKIGYAVIEITPEMVGRKIAVFTAIQTKTPSQKISKKKQGFIKSVQKDGGIAAITNALENWPEIVEDFINPQEEVEELQK